MSLEKYNSSESLYLNSDATVTRQLKHEQIHCNLYEKIASDYHLNLTSVKTIEF